LRAARKLATATGALALAGTAVVLRPARKLATASGAITLNGTAVTFRTGHANTIELDSGSFTLTGTAVTFKWIAPRYRIGRGKKIATIAYGEKVKSIAA